MSIALLGERTWRDVARAAGPVVAVPVGSCEQHGPHLPLSTDTIVATALCDALARHRADVVVAPAVGVGASGEHAGFAGTLSVGTEALARSLTELVRSARAWARAVVVVSAHGGNADALARVARTAAVDGDAVVVHAASLEGGDAHAGRTETSLVLALAPGLVRHNDLVPGVTTPLPQLAVTLRERGVAAVSPTGVLGDPTGASPEEGARLLGVLEADLCRAVDASLGGAEVSPVALVTGAARGIGAATVDALVAAGWHVLAVDRCRDVEGIAYAMATPADLDALVARHPGRVLGLVGDARSAQDMALAVETAVAQFGAVDAAVASAGVIGGGTTLWTMPDDVYDAVVSVNLDGVRRLFNAAVPALLEAPEPRHGRLVAVASAASHVGLLHLAAYSAAKHAVVGLVRGLAADLAHSGLTVNAVCPGSTRTAMLDASAALYGLDSPEELAAHQPIGRLLEPAEPAALIAWLCSEAASGITGAAVSVDGGMTSV